MEHEEGKKSWAEESQQSPQILNTIHEVGRELAAV